MMTEEAPRARAEGKRWLVACLALLLAVVVYNDTLDPMVRTFGLSHSKVFENGGSRVLVVDSLASADAPSVQTVFDGEIWGRHAYRVHQIVLPFLALLLAVGGLSHLLARRVSGVGAAFLQLGRGTATPPLGLWASLFFGGCFAAWSEEGPKLHPSYALLPFALAVLVTAGLSAGPRPGAQAMSRAFSALGAGRWFWLGFLIFSPTALFSYEGLVEGANPLQISPSAVLACVLSLLVLHWATRPPKAMDLSRFAGQRDSLRVEYERSSVLCLQELWLLVPAVLMAAVVSSLRTDDFAAYLLLSAACALLMKWSVAARPCQSDTLGDRALTLGFRLGTLALLLGVPYFVQSGSLPEIYQPAPVVWLTLIALGVVRGRPWTGGVAVADSTETGQPLAALGRPNLGTIALALATVAVVGVALRGGLPLPARDLPLAKAQAELGGSFGHQARLIRLDGQALLIGCNLDVARMSLAAEIVSNHLPDDETKVVSVRTRRWERTGRFFLAFTVAVFLVFPTYLLTFASPGPASRSYLVFCALLAGANGAFAVGSALGWFWLDPMPHLAAFALSTGLSWLGLGYARAWVDHRVSPAVQETPGLATARN